MKRLYSLIAIACIALTAMPQAHGRFARLRQVASTMASRFKTAGFNAFGRLQAQPRAVKFLAAGFGTTSALSAYTLYTQHHVEKLRKHAAFVHQLREQQQKIDAQSELLKLYEMREKLHAIIATESREKTERQFQHEKELKQLELDNQLRIEERKLELERIKFNFSKCH